MSPNASRLCCTRCAEADDESYAQVCEALRGFDVRDRLGDVRAPVLAVAGSEDVATPPALVEDIAAGIPTVGWSSSTGSPTSRRPRSVRRRQAAGPAPGPTETRREPDHRHTRSVLEEAADALYDQGMAVRREVLGDAHVDRATAGASPT